MSTVARKLPPIAWESNLRIQDLATENKRVSGGNPVFRIATSGKCMRFQELEGGWSLERITGWSVQLRPEATPARSHCLVSAARSSHEAAWTRILKRAAKADRDRFAALASASYGPRPFWIPVHQLQHTDHPGSRRTAVSPRSPSDAVRTRSRMARSRNASGVRVTMACSPGCDRLPGRSTGDLSENVIILNWTKSQTF